MANELIHTDVGTSLTETEYDAITAHQFNSQAVGDILYASSTSQLSRLGVGSDGAFLTLASGKPAWAGIGGASALQVNDNVNVALGTGSDSTLYYDGTDTFWNLRAGGTGDLMIALAGSFPSPDVDLVHIWKGDAGAASAVTNTVLALEDTATTYISFLSPTSGGLIFGDVADDDVGRFLYIHSSNRFEMYQSGTQRYVFTSDTLTFQQAHTINTSSGDLTINATASLNVTLTDDDADAFDISNSASTYYLIDTRNTVSGNITHLIDTENYVLPNNATATAVLWRTRDHTLTLAGTTTVTSPINTTEVGARGIAQSGGAVIVNEANSLVLTTPSEGTDVTLVDATALRITNAAGTPTNQHGIYIETLTAGATADYMLTLGDTDADQNLIHIDNTENALFYWDDSDTAFAFDEAVKLDTGHLIFPATQNASSGANVLDDYEEGTWTVALTDSSNSDSESQTYGSRSAWYRKIGSLVIWKANFTITSLGSLTTSDGARLNGFPFTFKNLTGSGEAPVQCHYGTDLGIQQFGSITGRGQTNTTTVHLSVWDLAFGQSNLLVSEVTGAGVLHLHGAYITEEV